MPMKIWWLYSHSRGSSHFVLMAATIRRIWLSVETSRVRVRKETMTRKMLPKNKERGEKHQFSIPYIQ